MTATNVTYTYKDLRNIFLQWIKDNCQNIDGLKYTVDKSMRTDFSVMEKSRRSASGDWMSSNMGGGGVTITINNNTAVTPVSSAKVESQFDSFMASRNFETKIDNEIILSTNGILNFWNNVAAFCNKRLTYVSSTLSVNTVLIYNDSANIIYDTTSLINSKKINYVLLKNTTSIPLNVTVASKNSILKVTVDNIALTKNDYELNTFKDSVELKTTYSTNVNVSVEFFPVDEVITAAHVDEMLLQLKASVNNSARVRSVTYTWSTFSSSSSCSSSSSSCSSSSSSSSYFIGYMKLGK